METDEQPLGQETVDLAAILQEEAARTGARAETSEVKVEGDARLLRRMLRNLLENAARHAEGKEVEAGAAPGPDGSVRLWVADRGPGVPADERERVFEPFYVGRRSASERPAGAGLGLALVRQIAFRHGGSAQCLDRPGGGALFEVTLPATPPRRP
jgi:signal transduction histidine kinase